MDWTKDFYSKQYKLLQSPNVWASFSPNNPPDPAKRRAAAVERLAGAGRKQILELGCGSGIVSAAMACLGNSVLAVDIVESAIINAKRYAQEIKTGELKAVQADFYDLKLDDQFDVVCYFDGFGIGSDDDQQRLLTQIATWLRPGGCALIDVYSPWLFSHEDGEVYQEGHVCGRTVFDAENSRLLDSIWLKEEDESKAITQTLRCYSPADFKLLLSGTGLQLHSFEPYESAFAFDQQVPLKEAEIYLAKLVHAADSS